MNHLFLRYIWRKEHAFPGTKYPNDRVRHLNSISAFHWVVALLFSSTSVPQMDEKITRRKKIRKVTKLNRVSFRNKKFICFQYTKLALKWQQWTAPCIWSVKCQHKPVRNHVALHRALVEFYRNQSLGKNRRTFCQTIRGCRRQEFLYFAFLKKKKQKQTSRPKTQKNEYFPYEICAGPTRRLR